jgi:hypothetical protein
MAAMASAASYSTRANSSRKMGADKTGPTPVSRTAVADADYIGAGGDRNAMDNPLSQGQQSFDSSQLFAKLQEDAAKQGIFEKLDKLPFCMEVLTYAISPVNMERLVWDSVVLAMVFYSTFSEPYSAAFYSDPDDNTHLFWNTFGQCVDLLFWVDIVANFFTGFDRGFEIVLDKRAIIQNYCFGWGWFGGWFWIDLVATIDWVWVAKTAGTENADTPVIRMMRLLKVLRLARASRLINRLTSTLSVHTGYIEALKFFMYVGIVAHLLACFFYLWPVLKECPGDTATADSLFLNVDPSTVGWQYEQSCMQGSWRQSYGLETVCVDGMNYDTSDWEDVLELRICQETAEFRLTKDEEYDWTPRDGINMTTLCSGWTPATPNDVCPYRKKFKAKKCKPCMNAMRLYIDAMYWSLTTMTTIGYGDRGPSTESEIVFVMFAEVFGLAFFALLLTQINKVADVMGERSEEINGIKNGVVQFLKAQHLDKELVDDAVKFLNFRSGALSVRPCLSRPFCHGVTVAVLTWLSRRWQGNAFESNDDRFQMLSPGLKRQIQVAVYRPVMQNVRIFGWNELDLEEELAVKAMFDRIDTDRGGTLDHEETKQLFKDLDLELTPSQFEQCFAELDSTGTKEIEYVEFKRWWYLKKNGRPQITKCPSAFLDIMCTKIKTQCFAKGEQLIEHGKYGEHFVILLSGKCQVMRDTDQTVRLAC